MKAINQPTGKEISIHYANALTAGYGHKKITVELEHQNQYCKFSSTTSNMPGYDAAIDLENTGDRYTALYELIETAIEDQVAEWLMSID